MQEPLKPLPMTVKAAAALLLIYGLWVVWRATVLQQAGDWADAGDYPRAWVRLAGMALIAVGLLRRRRWAWWLGVLLPALFVVTGLALVVIALSFAGRDGLVGFAGDMTDVVVAVPVVLTSVTLLLLPRSRAAFRPVPGGTST